MTKIERLLFTGNVCHVVVAFALSEGQLMISIAPRESPNAPIAASFSQVHFQAIDVYAEEPTDLDLPWEIIGFDCYSWPSGRWQFTLHTTGVEYIWQSHWPTIIGT